jgi:hypothetical protein
LLERAPLHYEALRALADGNLQSASMAAAMAGNGEAVVFGGLAAIRGAVIADGRLRLVIEALCDDTPGLAVEVRERKFNWWSQHARIALSTERSLQAGERVVVDLPIDRAKLSRLSVSIIADNPHIRGELPVRPPGPVWVADLLRTAARCE